jgi:glyoxylase-like metal-dependent hydrolase (beta-lactamase superfamily II)
MSRVPLEDNFTDVIGKAQRGLRITDEQLAALAEVSRADLAAVRAGAKIDAVIRRVARHLKLDPDALEDLAHDRWYPEQIRIHRAFAMFNTVFDDMRVNSYLIWDSRERCAAVFDTGASCDELLDVVRAEKLDVHYILLTHTHDDHIADLAKLAAATGAQVWANEAEPVDFPGARTFKENAHFHLASVAIKALTTSGHSPGQTSYYVTGLGRPLAVVGDSLFAGSIGGSATHFLEQYRNDRQKIFSLPRDTVLACGHGPLSSVAQELIHNPFFAYGR